MGTAKINTALVTTVANFGLYRKTSPSFPITDKVYVIDGTNGMHALHSIRYMMKKLSHQNIEWLIMADEDVVFINPGLVFPIIEKMEAEGFTVCGVRDGGVVSHRNQNPYLINTFFSILHFSEVEAVYNEKEMMSNQFTVKDEFEDDIANLPFTFDVGSTFEPYYCFYNWIRRKGKKILFLEAGMPFEDDAVTNAVYFDSQPLLYHTWHARSYGKSEKHTNRIDKVISHLQKQNLPVKQYELFKDKNFAFKSRANKFKKRFKNHIKLIFRK